MNQDSKEKVSKKSQNQEDDDEDFFEVVYDGKEPLKPEEDERVSNTRNDNPTSQNLENTGSQLRK